ncbi:Pre-mRNA-splicing factor ISY1 [Orchesella cincta]|uniref:Pre-mRNA-splicing factor ISY1 n=1 Tax=Orchesella cincta TaxID=48709 RepID=A0A1D2N8A7_ORCCI|nr:Pre-mRNA-splicing factor ISY1 [Orchesella cincta]
MARNSEKAMTTLARWHAMKLEEERGPKQERRPYLSTLCENLPEAEKWRMQIVREIAKKVSQIQNAGLGEFKLRDLNDEINKLLREKSHWERRIRQLGGPDYAKHGPRMLDNEGKEVPGTRGYKYFGAAKDLPGVRELFEPEVSGAPRKTRGELMRDVDADYYGYRDDDDGLLEPLEKEAEILALKKLEEEWIEKRKQKGKSVPEPVPDIEKQLEEIKNYFIQVPSQTEIEQKIVDMKKKALLEQYVSPEISSKDEEAKKMLGLI